jgi:hypothetical protein
MFHLQTRWMDLWKLAVACLHEHHSFFLSFVLIFTPFYLLILGVESYCSTFPHSMTHAHTHSVGLFWTMDEPVAETATWQQTTLSTERYPCPRRDSNPHSQQASGCRPTPQTVRLLGSVAWISLDKFSLGPFGLIVRHIINLNHMIIFFGVENSWRN